MEVRNSGGESQSLDRSQPIQKIDADGAKLAGGPVGVVTRGGGGGVTVEVGNAGGEAQVVKKKRGRPPRVQANPPAAKKCKEEDEDEDVCFICFDGGSLVLCDRRGCPKAYHPACIKRDEAFFRSKAKWNCGWHICSICEKASHHMCYTCTYSLCKGCIKKSDYVCVRGDKGFCTICMKTIMLIENSGQGKDETAKVDFDDKTSWEYLFKVYWVYLKDKLSLTFNELTQATNPWKQAGTVASVVPSTSLHIRPNGLRSITAMTSGLSFQNPEANEPKRQKTNEDTNGPDKETNETKEAITTYIEKVATDENLSCKEWASKELLDFVSHMKNGDTSMLSQFDVQALLLEYIKRNNLRKKNQIECDLRLKTLFGKPQVGHIEMLKLLEFHFLGEKKQGEADSNNVNSNNIVNNDTPVPVIVKERERRSQRKAEQRVPQNKPDEFAAIDVQNMNLIYLRQNLVQKLLEDHETFHDKVVGSIVQIRISGSDQEHDMYRLVQVVGTTKVDVPYKMGNKLVDIMLEVLNLDKKEGVSIDTISNQELSEDDCRRLRESIRCGLVRCFTVGEIQEKAMALQSVLLDDRLQTEMTRLNQFVDRASEKGQKKGVRDCAKKLKLLKRPEERERRLRELPEVHSDPKMNPDYESDDTEEYFNNEHGEHPNPKYPWVSGPNTTSPQKQAKDLPDQQKKSTVPTDPKPKEGSKSSTVPTVPKPKEGSKISTVPIVPKPEEGSKSSTVSTDPKPEEVSSNRISNTEKDFVEPQKEVICDGSPVEKQDQLLSPDDVAWHYRDPSGNIQGPFPMSQLQKWNQSGYFPADMKVWANRERDAVILNNFLQQQFNSYNLRSSKNVFSDKKIVNHIERVDVCSPIPSSTVPVTTYGLNPVNSLGGQTLTLDPPSTINESTKPYALNSVNVSGQPFGQTLTLDPPSTINESTKPYVVNSVNVSGQPSCQTLTLDPPSSINESTKPYVLNSVNRSGQYSGQTLTLDPPSTISESTKPNALNSINVSGQPLGQTLTLDPPSTVNESTKLFDNPHVSPVFTVADLGLVNIQSPLPKKTGHEDEKVRDTPSNPPIWSTTLSLVVGGPDLPEPANEWAGYSAGPIKREPWDSGPGPGLGVGHVTAPIPPTTIEPSWHGLGETIEFSTLAEESVSDLLAEVDAMESRNGVPSPTSRRNSFLEDLFNGSIDEFSPTGDPGGTRTDGFNSSANDIQLNSTGHNVFDLVKRSTGLQFSDNIGFKWGRQDMIDLNDSTRAEADDLDRETRVSPGLTLTSGQPVAQAPAKLDEEQEEGEFIQPEVAPSPPPPPPPPLLPPPPPPPPPATMVDSRRVVVPETMQGNPKNTVRASSSGRRSGSTGRERESHHRRSGDRYNTSSSSNNSPRERAASGHHVDDLHSRSSRASWGRQSSFGTSGSIGGSGGGGSGGGYSRPVAKGQRVCKFYESGRCKKGSTCNYLHP